MQTEARTAPINIRARHTQRELIDRAAAAQHKSRSNFILEAACKEAENVLLDQRLFLLDERQFAEFASEKLWVMHLLLESSCCGSQRT